MLVSRECMAWKRKSCVYINLPTLNKFISLCRIHETKFLPKFTTEQVRKAESPLCTVTFPEVVAKSKRGLSSIDGISEVLLKILSPKLCSRRRSLSFSEWWWMFVIDATPSAQPSEKWEDFYSFRNFLSRFYGWNFHI